jgi:hypothetical protein
MTDAELLEEERKKKEAKAMGGVQPQAPVMNMSQENPDFGAMLRSSGVPDSNVVAQVPGIENVRNPGAFDPVGSPSVDEIPPMNAPARGVTRRDVSAPDQVVPAGRFGGQSEARLSDVGLSPVQGRGRIAPPSVAAQAPTEASAPAATPSATPTVETLSEDAQGQVGAVQSPFLQSPDAPSGTESVSGLRTDPQGRMIPSGFETRADAFSNYEDQAAAREARLADRPDFGEAVSDRDRRAARGEGISMADRTAMAKANARDASPREIARGNKIADELGVDLGTGQPRETEAEDTRTPEQIESDRLAIEAQKLQNERSRQIIAEANKPDATPFAKKRGEWEERAEALREDGMSEKEISARRRAFLAGDTFDPLLFDEGDSTVETQGEDSTLPASTAKTHQEANAAAKKAGKSEYTFEGKKYKVQ